MLFPALWLSQAPAGSQERAGDVPWCLGQGGVAAVGDPKGARMWLGEWDIVVFRVNTIPMYVGFSLLETSK